MTPLTDPPIVSLAEAMTLTQAASELHIGYATLCQRARRRRLGLVDCAVRHADTRFAFVTRESVVDAKAARAALRAFLSSKPPLPSA